MTAQRLAKPQIASSADIAQATHDTFTDAEIGPIWTGQFHHARTACSAATKVNIKVDTRMNVYGDMIGFLAERVRPRMGDNLPPGTAYSGFARF
jgi:hypothetical protein